MPAKSKSVPRLTVTRSLASKKRSAGWKATPSKQASLKGDGKKIRGLSNAIMGLRGRDE